MSPRRLKTVLKKLREEKGVSQRDLAQQAKVTGAYIAQLETGVRKNPSLDTLKRLAKALGVSVPELFTPPTKAKQPARKRAPGLPAGRGR